MTSNENLTLFLATLEDIIKKIISHQAKHWYNLEHTILFLKSLKKYILGKRDWYRDVFNIRY